MRAGSGKCPEPLTRPPRRLSPSASPAPGVSHLPSSPALTSGRGPWQPPGSRTPEGSRRAPGETSRPASVKAPPRPHSAPGTGTRSSRVQMATLGTLGAPERGSRQDRIHPPPRDLSQVPRTTAPLCLPRCSANSPQKPYRRQHPAARAPSQALGLPWGVSGTPLAPKQPGSGPRSLPHRRPRPASREQAPQEPLQVASILPLGEGAAGSGRGRLRK